MNFAFMKYFSVGKLCCNYFDELRIMDCLRGILPSGEEPRCRENYGNWLDLDPYTAESEDS